MAGVADVYGPGVAPPSVGGFTAPGNWTLTPNGWQTAAGIPAAAGGGGYSGQVSRDALEKTYTPSEHKQATVAALDSLIPVPYGRQILRALLVRPFDYAGQWLFFILWSEGFDSFVRVMLDDAELPDDFTWRHYTGETWTDSSGASGSQTTADPTLVSAYQALGLTWDKVLSGLAYSWISVPYTRASGNPRFNAEVLGRKVVQFSGTRRNLIDYTTFANAGWATNNATLTANTTSTTAPDGSLSAVKLTESNTTNGFHRTNQNPITATLANSTTYCLSLYAKAAERSWISVRWTAKDGSTIYQTYFNLAAGTMGTSTAGSASITDAGSGWYRLCVSGNSLTGSGGLIRIEIATADNTNSYTGVVGSGIYIWRAQFEAGSTATAAQVFPTTYTAAITPAWTDCPAFIAADFETSAVYGAGNEIDDWAAVHTVAAFNNQLAGTAPNTETMRRCDIVIDREATLDNWRETLRAAAACFRIENQGRVKFIADAPIPPSFSYSHADGNIMLLGDPKFRDLANLPTVIEVTYTDASVYPWKDNTVTFKRNGVREGTVPYIKSPVRMPWIRSAAQALREATERSNKQYLRSLTFDLEVFDEGVLQEPGDIGGVTYPDNGLAGLPVRVVNTRESARGWVLSLEKEDFNAYNYSVQAVEGTPTTSWPSPSSPPTPTGITLRQDIFQQQTGRWATRLIVSWDEVIWPFIAGFNIQISDTAGVICDTGHTRPESTSYTSAPLRENEAHNVSVSVASVTGATSAVPGVATISADDFNGRAGMVPTDVPSISAYEIAGETHLSWTLPVDFDVVATELRYGAVGVSWSSATLIDRVPWPQSTFTTKLLPQGTWVVLAKGLDSVRTDAYPHGQESVNATSTAPFTVTLDADAFLVASRRFEAADVGVSNMAAITRYDGTQYWITEDASLTFAAQLSSNVSTYTNVLATYFIGIGSSIIEIGPLDAGTDVDGEWFGSFTFEKLADDSSGFVEWYIMLAKSAGPYQYVGYLTGAVKARARYAKLTAGMGGNGVFKVTSLGSASVNAIGRRESSDGVVFTSSAGPVTVLFTTKFAKLKSAQVTPYGSTAYIGSVDRVLVNPDASGAVQFEVTNNATAGDHYQYVSIKTGASLVTLQTGDVFMYDVLIPATSVHVDQMGGMDFRMSDLTYFSVSSVAEATDGDNVHNPTLSTYNRARQQWWTRSFTVPVGLNGKVIDRFYVVCHANDASELFIALYRNVIIKRGGSTIYTAYATSGEPDTSEAPFTNLISGYRIGQANAMDIYLFDTAGAKVTQPASWTVEGV